MAEKIGSQHGIVAFHNRERDKDPGGTLLKKGPDGKWPDMWEELSEIPLDKWKAIDKHQRAEEILCRDHDASFSSGGGGNGGTPPPVNRPLTIVQNVLILAEDPWPALESPLKYRIWITADLGYRHYYEDGSFIHAAKDQGRIVFSWCDCKKVLGTGTSPQVAIDMANEYGLDGAAGEGEHSLAFEDGYKAGMRVFVCNMSALTQAQIDMVNADGETVITAELYRNLQPGQVVDWKYCDGVGSNCAAIYQTTSEVTSPISQDDYLNDPSVVPSTLSWYCGGNPKPDYRRLP